MNPYILAKPSLPTDVTGALYDRADANKPQCSVAMALNPAHTPVVFAR